jgi:hypothetical protein
MKRLVVFGDSFAKYDWVEQETTCFNWSTYLGQQLDIPVVNNAVSGSGLVWTLIRFHQYIMNEGYDPEDIFVFVLTNEQRLYAWNMPDPSLGIFYNLLNVVESRSPRERQWIKENKDHALWAMDEICDPKINYNILHVASFLKVWSEHNITNKVIVLKCFKAIQGGEKISQLHNLITPTKNFFPILNEDDVLADISSKEFKDSSLHQYMLTSNAKTPGLDYRVNHLSSVNREVLSNQLATIIETESLSSWDRSKFVSNLYNTKDDVDKMNVNFF